MEKDIKLGIFLCDCGETLSKVVSFSAIKAKLESDGAADYVGMFHDLCLKKAQKAMQKEIKDKGISRVVVVGCSPELHEKTFAEVLVAAGVNPHLLSMANIREQCVWVHSDRDKAAQKAAALIELAIRRAGLLEPVENADVPVNREVLIVGGGIVGIQAAIELSDLNVKATLIEKEATLGGKLNCFARLHPADATAEEVLITKIGQLAEKRIITALTSAELVDVTGEVGRFSARIRKGGKEFTQNFGAIILATGYEAKLPALASKMETSGNVVTQAQLQAMLKSPGDMEEMPKNVGFITEVSDEHSRISTQTVLTNVLAVKERLGSEVYVFCKNLKVDGDGLEKLYRDCRSSGAIFMKFDKPPGISRQDGHIQVQVEDVLTPGEQLVVSCDLLVSDETTKPHGDSLRLGSLLSLGLGPRGFYQQDNVHLYPTASNREGIFVAGNCHAELDLTRALAEASNAALAAYHLLSQGKVTVSAEMVWIDPAKCRFCLTCIRACPHSAISEAVADHQTRVARITDLACGACGVCVAVCPAKAIKFKGWSDDQILAELEPVGEYL